MIKRLSTVLFLSILISLITKYALADDTMKPEKVMKIRLKPYLGYSAGITKNVELLDDSDNAKERWVNNYLAGLILQVPLKRLYIETGYEFVYYDAAGYKGQPVHLGRGLIRYELSETASIGIEDVYQTSTVDFIGSKRYELNTASANLKKQLNSRLSSGLKYTFVAFNATNDRLIDYKDNGADMNFDYRLTPLITLGLNVNWRKRSFRHDEEAVPQKDYDTWGGVLSISRRFLQRLSGSIKVGYTRRDYDQGGDDDFVTYGGGLNANLTNFSNLTIDYEHSLQDTFYPLADWALLSASPFIPNQKIAGSLIDTNYRQIETDRVITNLTYRITAKDTVNVGFTYIWSKSGSSNAISGDRTIDLDEESYAIGAGYSRKLTKWVSLGINGVYGSRKSNARNDYDYKQLGGLLSLAISY